MWITRTAIAHPVFATMVMVALTVCGLYSSLQLGTEAMPDVKLPMVTVSVAYPGASPEQVESDVTKPLESVLNTIGGIKLVRSLATEGLNRTFVEFRLDADVTRAVQDVRDKVAQVRPGFPREVQEPSVSRVDTDNDQPIAMYDLNADLRSPRELSYLALKVVGKRLERVAGVGRVDIDGTVTRQIEVRLRAERLAAMGLTVEQVTSALRSQNISVPVGRLADVNSEVVVRVDGRLRSPADFADIPVAHRGMVPVRLGQVAQILDTEREPETLARVNGKPAIGILVYKAQDANAVSTGREVRVAVEELRKNSLPSGVELRLLYDSAEWIEKSIDNVRHTILEGGCLTVLIVFLFLGSWRSTVITGLTLPISVIATLTAIYAAGFTLNYMTLMALSLCIGLLIDDAIVVRENIVRHLHMGKPSELAAREGTEEVGLAVFATTLTIVAVFVPIAFMKGIVGKFFFAFGITVAVSVLLSLFISFTLDPMLSAVWHDPHHERGVKRPLGRLLDRFEALFDRLGSLYDRTLALALRRRKTTLALALLSLVIAIPLFGVVGTEFVPKSDNSYLSMDLTLPVGSSLAHSDGLVRQVEEKLSAFPEIETRDTRIGTNRGRNEAHIDLSLYPPEKRSRSQFVIEADVRKALQGMAGVLVKIGGGGDSPIVVNLVGDSDEALLAAARDLKSRVEKVRGIRDVDLTVKEGTPTVAVRLKPDLAGEIGMTHAQLGSDLRALIDGDRIGDWLSPDGQNVPVVTRIAAADREHSADISTLPLVTGRSLPNGLPEILPLSALADVVPVYSPENIRRQNLQRRVALTANVEGRSTGEVGREVEQITKALALPPGIHIEINGDLEQQQESGAAVLSVLLLSVIFIYIVLASQFGSFFQPIAIMASLPLSVVGVVLALLASRTTLNIFSMIGIVFLMGLVTKNAILLVDFANRGVREGMDVMSAVARAGRIRLRPILMTTAAMIFGMLPLSLGLGQGAEEQAPMGRAIIGGVITSTLLTLVVVPVIYTYISGWEQRWRRRSASL